MTPLWRRAFDTVERPMAAASEAWVQSDAFMNLAAAAVRTQRRLLDDLHSEGERWLHTLGLQSHGDIIRTQNQLGQLEREVRQLRRELERRTGGSQQLAATQRRAA